MADEPVERMRAQRHQWSPDNRAHLPLACYIPRRQRQLQPLHTHTRYPLVTPSRKSAVPELVRHPTRFALLTDLLCAEDELGVGWGDRAPSLAEPPSPPVPQACTPSTGLESGANQEKISPGIRREHPERKGDLRQEDARSCRMS